MGLGLELAGANVALYITYSGESVTVGVLEEWRVASWLGIGLIGLGIGEFGSTSVEAIDLPTSFNNRMLTLISNASM